MSYFEDLLNIYHSNKGYTNHWVWG